MGFRSSLLLVCTIIIYWLPMVVSNVDLASVCTVNVRISVPMTRTVNYTAMENVQVKCKHWYQRKPCYKNQEVVKSRLEHYTVERNKSVTECCAGYKSHSTHRLQCDPICNRCDHGKCVLPNTCECFSNYRWEDDLGCVLYDSTLYTSEWPETTFSIESEFTTSDYDSETESNIYESTTMDESLADDDSFYVLCNVLDCKCPAGYEPANSTHCSAINEFTEELELTRDNVIDENNASSIVMIIVLSVSAGMCVLIGIFGFLWYKRRNAVNQNDNFEKVEFNARME